MRSHVNKNKNHNRLSEHFRQELCSQKTRNGVSEYQDFKLFWGRLILEPPSGSPLRNTRDSSIIKKYPDFTYSKGWTICDRYEVSEHSAATCYTRGK